MSRCWQRTSADLRGTGAISQGPRADSELSPSLQVCSNPDSTFALVMMVVSVGVSVDVIVFVGMTV
jgi:hypothetical protein